MESPRFTVQELQRTRHQQQSRDPGCATQSVPYQSLQGDRVQGAPVAPQFELPPPFARRSAQMPAASVHTTQVCSQPAASVQRARCLQSA